MLRIVIIIGIYLLLYSIVYRIIKKKYGFWAEELKETTLSDKKDELKNKKEIFNAELKETEREIKNKQKEINKLKKD